MMDIRISVLDDVSRIDEIIDLFSKGLGKTTREHWMWRLFTPNGMKQPEAIIAEDEKNRIVGMTSILFEEYGNQEYGAIQFCDWVVSPEYRGQGIIGKLYRYALKRYEEDNFDFIIEYPNNNSFPIFQKYGFEIKMPIGSWNTSSRVYLGNPGYNSKTKGSISYCFSQSCPLQDNDFIQKPGRIFRNRQFMEWKYDLNPDTDFEWLTVKDSNELLGYFVFTITHGRIRRVVNIYDWDFKSDKVFEFSNSIKLLRKYGNSVCIWGRYPAESITLMEFASMKFSAGGTRLILKSISDRGYPDELTLSRADTDY